MAKAMRIVGEVGIEGIPPERVQKMEHKGKPWSVLESDNILAIADTFN